MGRNAKLRAAKKNGTHRPPQAPQVQLLECLVAIGDRFGTQARCVEAAWLLKYAGDLLGYDLTMRAVSVVARDTVSGDVALMGSKAEDLVPEAANDKIIDLRPADQGTTGHVVLTCEDPLLLLDPNLRQLGAHGIAAPSVVVKIRSAHPESGTWEFAHDNLQLLYMVDDTDRRLLDGYDDMRDAWAREAADLVRLIRGGKTAQDLRQTYLQQ